MTFDEAFKVICDEKFGTTIKDETPRHTGDPKKFDFVILDDGIGTGIEILVDLITQLKEEYAPTVEMTKRHKDNLIYMKNEGYSFFETIADIDSGVLIREFDSYWNPLTVDELMQAWLHPETIKIVE